MWRLAAAFAEVALRRRGPETLPDSTFLMLVLLCVDLVVSIVYLAFSDGLSWLDVGVLLADTSLSFAFVFAVLRFFKLERRYRQTMSAWLGVDIWITVIFMSFVVPAWAMHLSLESGFFIGLALALILWQIFIYGWVLARSLSQPLIVGLMFEILLTLTSLSVRDLLVPVTN